jgi:predicted nucleotidyltransferase
MAKRLPENIEQVLVETKSQLKEIYAQRLKEIILFGSYARGDYVAGSDVDLLVLLETVNDPEAERELYLPVVCDVSLKYDTVVSVISMDYETYRSKKTPLILNAQREGVRI